MSFVMSNFLKFVATRLSLFPLNVDLVFMTNHYQNIQAGTFLGSQGLASKKALSSI